MRHQRRRTRDQAPGTRDETPYSPLAPRPSTLSSRPARRRLWRGAVFRLAAVLAGLTPFVLAEAMFTTLDWARPDYSEDPFVGFRAVHPLFVLNKEGTQYEIAPSRQGYFRPDSFAAQKAPNEFRIFCLGGSTVQGRPFAIETSFTTWLEISLQAADPKRQWEVVNCGGVSYASYRLVPILKEVLAYEPDLIILYTGHNEFLEDRTYGHIKHLPELIARPCEFVSRTRTYTMLRRRYLRLRGGTGRWVPKDRPILASEVDAMLEYRGGLEQYHRDEKWRRDTIEHFRYNLYRMVQMARDAGVPLLLVNPVCKLRDCAPFKTQHRDGLTADELSRWKSLVSKAGDCYARGSYYQAVTYLQQAMEIDDQHAGIHFMLAKCYDALGMTAQARQSYLQAKELDICPLRILEPMNQAILEVARRTHTKVVDLWLDYDEFSEMRRSKKDAGNFWLIDHVHPSIAGHQQVARLLADELVREGIVHPLPTWKQEEKRRFEQHLGSLDDLYFLRGERRWDVLRCWTQGKAGGVRGAIPQDSRESGQQN